MRLPGGKFFTRPAAVESRPEDVARAQQDEVWLTADDRLILISDMDMRHLLNAMRTLERRAKAIMSQFNVPGADENETLRQFTSNMDRRYATMLNELAVRAGKAERRPEVIEEGTRRKFTV